MNDQPILEIKDLNAGVEGKQILKGINLTISAGEVHAVMGPNGSGKSTYFLKSALNEIRKHKGQSELDAMEFLELVKGKIKLLDLNQDLLLRSVNEGFSGGEKKRNEIFQMAVLEPKLAILDETDSGLDIDALKIVAHGVNKLKHPNNAQLVITHYQRLLNYIVPDFVHVLHDGRIVRSGGKELALELEDKGYELIVNRTA